MCWGHIPYAHPQHIKVVKHFVYVWHRYKINLDWVYSFNHPISPWFVAWDLPRSLANSKSLVNLSSHYVLRTHPYAHPQHMKVVKHFVYVWHWCEIDLGWVYSLNHRISPWFVAWELPRSLANSKSLVNASSCNVVRTHPICTSTAYEACQTLCICLKLM